jgi:hypothetical protein
MFCYLNALDPAGVFGVMFGVIYWIIHNKRICLLIHAGIKLTLSVDLLRHHNGRIYLSYTDAMCASTPKGMSGRAG